MRFWQRLSLAWGRLLCRLFGHPRKQGVVRSYSLSYEVRWAWCERCCSTVFFTANMYLFTWKEGSGECGVECAHPRQCGDCRVHNGEWWGTVFLLPDYYPGDVDAEADLAQDGVVE